MNSSETVEVARPIGGIRTEGVERLEGRATAPFGFQVTDRGFGVRPTPNDDVLQVRAERNLDRGFVARRKVDELGDGTFDSSELAASSGRQDLAHASIEPRAAFLDALQGIELGASL